MPKRSKAKKYSLVRHFETWLNQNRHKFAAELEILERDGQSLRMKYKNIIPNIQPLLLQGGSSVEIEVRVEYQGEIWDSLGDFWTEIGKNKERRYYCMRCEPNQREFYTSREQLVEAHVFDTFLEWTNENIKVANHLLIFEHITRGGRWAEILCPLCLQEYLSMMRPTSKILVDSPLMINT